MLQDICLKSRVAESDNFPKMVRKWRKLLGTDCTGRAYKHEGKLIVLIVVLLSWMRDLPAALYPGANRTISAVP